MAVAAHGAAGAAAPDAAGALLLLGLAAVLAAAATSLPWLSSTAMGLLSLLGAGQLAGHLVLGVSAHHPGAIDASMVAAHVTAVAGCAGLIALAEQIGPRCSAALSRVLPQLVTPIPVVTSQPWRPICVDVPKQRSAVLAASVGRRGPPRL